MYTGFREKTDEWVEKTEEFLERAFRKAKGANNTWCPCDRCNNTRQQTKETMIKHLYNNGFTPNYTRWIWHGEKGHGMNEVVRQHIDVYNADARVGDMINDYCEA